LTHSDVVIHIRNPAADEPGNLGKIFPLLVTVHNERDSS
jgi:hypothetical protein